MYHFCRFTDLDLLG